MSIASKPISFALASPGWPSNGVPSQTASMRPISMWVTSPQRTQILGGGRHDLVVEGAFELTVLLGDGREWAAVTRRIDLRRQVPFVAGLVQRSEDLRPVERSLPRRPAVAICDVEIEQLRARAANRLQRRFLLHVHMEGVQAYADVGKIDLRGHRQSLVASIQEIGLEARDGLQRDLDA